MRHTTSEFVSMTRRQAPRMFRLLALIIPLCLALSLSFSLPAFAQQTHQTTTAHAHQASTSCTTPTSWLLSSPAGSVTVWSDSPEFPGPGTSNGVANISVTLDASTSPEVVCTFSLEASFTVTDPSTGNTITVVSANPSSSPGQFNPSTGALTLNGSLVLDNVPLIQGQVTTNPGSLSTDSTITTSAGTVISGKRLSSGNITLVGATQFTDLITVHVQTQIVGTFKPV